MCGIVLSFGMDVISLAVCPLQQFVRVVPGGQVRRSSTGRRAIITVDVVTDVVLCHSNFRRTPVHNDEGLELDTVDPDEARFIWRERRKAMSTAILSCVVSVNCMSLSFTRFFRPKCSFRNRETSNFYDVWQALLSSAFEYTIR